MAIHQTGSLRSKQIAQLEGILGFQLHVFVQVPQVHMPFPIRRGEAGGMAGVPSNVIDLSFWKKPGPGLGEKSASWDMLRQGT